VVEVAAATAEPESPAREEHLMEAICDPENIEAALRTVVRNKGAPGVDGTVRQLPDVLHARRNGRSGSSAVTIACKRFAISRNCVAAIVLVVEGDAGLVERDQPTPSTSFIP
jgi:hypothetical protein